MSAPETTEPEELVTLEWGIRRPDGGTDWYDADSGHFALDTEVGRAKQQDDYRRTLEGVGIVPTSETRLIFLTRDRVTTYRNEAVIPEPESRHAPAKDKPAEAVE